MDISLPILAMFFHLTWLHLRDLSTRQAVPGKPLSDWKATEVTRWMLKQESQDLGEWATAIFCPPTTCLSNEHHSPPSHMHLGFCQDSFIYPTNVLSASPVPGMGVTKILKERGGYTPSGPSQEDKCKKNSYIKIKTYVVSARN